MVSIRVYPQYGDVFGLQHAHSMQLILLNHLVLSVQTAV